MTLFTAEEQRRRDLQEAADRRYRLICRLNDLENAAAADAAAVKSRRPVTPTAKTPVTPRAAAAPVVKRVNGRPCEVRTLGDGRREERFLDDGAGVTPYRRYASQYLPGGHDGKR
jgi:hypothetical protein